MVGKGNGTETYITDGSQSPPPVVTLSDLRTRIAEIQAMLAEGQGVQGYETCIVSQAHTGAELPHDKPYINPVMEAAML